MTQLPEAEQSSPIHRAFWEDYHRMAENLRASEQKSSDLLVQSMNLMSEVHMLRDALERADADRVRLQAISSTLLGRLLAINDTIAGAVKASIKDGIEAVHAAKAEDDLEQAGAEAQEIIQRVEPVPPTPAAPLTIASVRAAVGPLAAVDWGLPQGRAAEYRR